ncbi:MAG: class I SAM-dependent methyltransferase [Paludibacter sp.]
MKNKDTEKFLADIIQEIDLKDPMHARRIKKDNDLILQIDNEQFELLLSLIQNYFATLNISISSVVTDYLQMINDMRVQRFYYLKHGKYACENQQAAYDKVYSNNEIMSYYMNALLVSQLFWKHHFNMFVYFKQQLKNHFNSADNINILDVGPGHGFFSYIVRTNIPNYNSIDIVDISEASLLMTQRMIGDVCPKTNYFNVDIFDYQPTKKYDLIILGEVIEHLDNPKEILMKLSDLLSPNGVLWVTAPTNAPAIDHVFLFRNGEEIIELINSSNLEVVKHCGFYSDDVTPEIARSNKVTELIGAFCKKVIL